MPVRAASCRSIVSIAGEDARPAEAVVQRLAIDGGAGTHANAIVPTNGTDGKWRLSGDDPLPLARLPAPTAGLWPASAPETRAEPSD